MAQRVFLSGNPPRLITSKPGYNASPSLPDEGKSFDSNWFDGGGIKFRYFGPVTANFVWYYPYALNFVPKTVVQMHTIWDGRDSVFNSGRTGPPGFPGWQVAPPSQAMCQLWGVNVSTAIAYNNRVEANNTRTTDSRDRILIMVFEA